jgi:hypothetical protein
LNWVKEVNIWFYPGVKTVCFYENMYKAFGIQNIKKMVNILTRSRQSCVISK